MLQIYMDTSRTKQRITSLYGQVGKLLPPLLRRCPLFAASLYEHKVRCGKPQCRCAKGNYRHRMWCVSFMDKEKSRTRVVPEGARYGVEKMTRDYRRFRLARREISELFEQLLEAVDALGCARCREGRTRYRCLLKKAKALRESGLKGGKKS